MGNTAGDRSRVAASDPSELGYFAKEHGLSDDHVKGVIKQHGKPQDS